MSCAECSCVVGEVYEMSGGTHDYCGSTIGSRLATYVGRQGRMHVFRVHNVVCPGCGVKLKTNTVPCGDFDGIDVTMEFSLLMSEKNA